MSKPSVSKRSVSGAKNNVIVRASQIVVRGAALPQFAHAWVGWSAEYTTENIIQSINA
jgi:hypothetical protein